MSDSEQLRRQVVRLFPELAAGYHLPVMAEVLGVSDAPEHGGIADNFRPRFAVDVELLTTQYKRTGIKLDSVPVSIMGGGSERGFFALPEKNSIVELAWLNGSPEHPFVRSVLGDRQALPHIDAETMTWQQNENCRQRVDHSGNWLRETDQSIIDVSFSYRMEAADYSAKFGNQFVRVYEHSVEDIDGKKQIEASAIHLFSMSVINCMAAGSINQVACDFITRAATKGIKDNATANIELVAGENITATAEENIELTAKKFHIGNDTDNLLSLLSETMQLLGDTLTNVAALTVDCPPSGPSSPPINAAAFTALAPQVAALKTKLDAMTK